MTNPAPQENLTFADLKLPDVLLQALNDVGYEHPTPIQQQTIPPLLEGSDVLGHAPTGTGKTAAFALPLIARDMAKTLDAQRSAAPASVSSRGKRAQVVESVRILVLAPTRELAIQVAEAFKRYASRQAGFSVVPIYGGQDYSIQLRQLQRGAQVVVGTPGRVMDHMRRGTLKLDKLSALVLDEGDEMLRMGFIDDIDWILEQTPKNKQMALFSATLPRAIQKIALKHLNNPVEIAIESKTTTAETINQRYWLVSGVHKLEALTRILEAETFDAVLVFVRTRTATVELAERLEARGHRAAAINGDLPQKQREKMIDQFKRGTLDILVATDVAARGLDVERVSHVINYDIPYDTEAYVHRIGRTGRAGRHGEAILFVTPRERRMLHTIEKATRQRISQLELPTTGMVNDKRINDFKQRISDTLNTGENVLMRRLVEEFQQEHNIPATDVAAALAVMVLGDKPLLLKEDHKSKRKDHAAPARRAAPNQPTSEREPRAERPTGASKPAPAERVVPAERPAVSLPPAAAVASEQSERPEPKERKERAGKPVKATKPVRKVASAPDTDSEPAIDMERFRVEVGAADDMKAGNLVGAIANEAGIDSMYIGKIEIFDNYAVVELPTGMPKEIFKDLKQTWVCGKRLRMTRLNVPVGHASGQKSSSKGPGQGAKQGENKGGKSKSSGKP